MYLIVGLGNPGQKYQNNRHNVGFMFIDYIAQTQNEKDSKFILAKPQTYMNKSGQAVKQIIENGKWKIENLVVVHDDLDIPLGKFRIDLARGPKLHNGIESIEQHLRTKDFLRVRIGVDNRQETGPVDGETYVLQNFKPEEKEIILKIFPIIFTQLKNHLPFAF